MENSKRKGRPTTHIVSVLDIEKNAIIFTGSVTDFVNDRFKYCSPKVKKSARAEMYISAGKGKTAFRGQVRVFDNLEMI